MAGSLIRARGETLGHAAGERAGRIVSPVIEFDELKQVKDAVAGIGHAVELGEELKVLHGREVAVHHGLVRDEPDAAAQLLGVLERVDAEHGEAAGSGTAHSGQDAQKRRLACAVRPCGRSNETPSSARRVPNAFLMSCTASAGVSSMGLLLRLGRLGRALLAGATGQNLELVLN